jgi:hypothetical protein
MTLTSKNFSDFSIISCFVMHLVVTKKITRKVARMKNRFRGTWVLLALLVLMVVFVGCEEVTVDVPEGAIRLIVHNMTEQQFSDHHYKLNVYDEDETQVHEEEISQADIEDTAESPYTLLYRPIDG